MPSRQLDLEDRRVARVSNPDRSTLAARRAVGSERMHLDQRLRRHLLKLATRRVCAPDLIVRRAGAPFSDKRAIQIRLFRKLGAPKEIAPGPFGVGKAIHK